MSYAVRRSARRAVAAIVIVAVWLSSTAVGPVADEAEAVQVRRCQGMVATIVAETGGVVTGTSGDDVIVGTAGADRIDGRGGNDVICGAGGDDVLVGGGGRDLCLGGTGATTFSGCERVGGRRLARIAAFDGGSWDAEYTEPRAWRILSACADRAPSLATQGFFQYVTLCGEAAYIGTFTPIPMICQPTQCPYPLGTDARAIGPAGRGAFRFERIGGWPISLSHCFRRAPFANDVEVTAIDGRGRVTEFRWRVGAGTCASIFGERSGWHAFTRVRVFRTG
jgi:hypothetical protein